MRMPLDPSPPLVVARRGQKHPSAVGSGDKSQITVLSCCSASGYALPPFIVEAGMKRSVPSRAGASVDVGSFGLAFQKHYETIYKGHLPTTHTYHILRV